MSTSAPGRINSIVTIHNPSIEVHTVDRSPGDLRDCSTCHVNSSYEVDNLGALASVATPGRFTPTTPPISAAHALANSNALGETFIICHGIGQPFAVDTVHARTQQ